jgi:hypothetical protein
MSAPNGTPGSEAAAPARLEYPPGCDIDTATLALSQAAAILNLLAAASDGEDIRLPDTEKDTLIHGIYAALSEVKRAEAALRSKEVR